MLLHRRFVSKCRTFAGVTRAAAHATQEEDQKTAETKEQEIEELETEEQETPEPRFYVETRITYNDDNIHVPIASLRNPKKLDIEPMAVIIPPLTTDPGHTLDFSKLKENVEIENVEDLEHSLELYKKRNEEVENVEQEYILSQVEKGIEVNPFQSEQLSHQTIRAHEREQKLVKESVDLYLAQLQATLVDEGEKIPVNTRRKQKLLIAMATTTSRDLGQAIETHREQIANEEVDESGAQVGESGAQSADGQAHSSASELLYAAQRKKHSGTNNERPGFWGYFVAALVGSIVMFGTAVPGFRYYVVEPFKVKFLGMDPDPNRIR